MYKIYLSLLLVSFTYANTVNYNEILQLTLTNNKKLKNQKLDIQNSQLNIKEVDALNLGKLSFIEEVSRTNHSGHVFNSKLSSREASFRDFGFAQQSQGIDVKPTDLNHPKDRNNFTTKVTYDIPLFTGFKLSNQKAILELQQKAQEVKYKLNKKELSFEVLKAYNAAVVAKEFIEAASKAKEAITFVVKSAKAFHKEGLVTKIDVKQAKVYELNTNTKLIEAQNQFDLAIAYLRFLSSDETITDVSNLKNIYCDISTLENLYERALKNRDDLQMQNLQKDAMKKNIELSKSSYYPNIYSHLEYGFNDNTLTLDNDKDYYMAMLGINYTIFDNTRKIQKQKAKIQYKKTTLDLENLKDYIRLELDKSLLNLKAKEKVLNEKQEAKNLAQEVFEQSNLMYKNQLIAMTNLLEQEANLRNMEAQYIVARYEFSLALAKIATVLGVDFSNTKYNKENK